MILICKIGTTLFKDGCMMVKHWILLCLPSSGHQHNQVHGFLSKVHLPKTIQDGKEGNHCALVA